MSWAHIELSVVAVGIALSHGLSHLDGVMRNSCEVVIDALIAQALHQVLQHQACTRLPAVSCRAQL